MTDTIITGRKFRVCVDSTQDKWNVISFWVKAQDVELDSGMNVQDFVTNINSQITGILSDSLSDSTDTAPTSRLLKDQITTLNNNFNNSVTGIFNKLKDYGYTPTNTSLDSIIAALTNMYNGRYKAGQDNVKGATLTTSNFNGAVSNGKYNITSTSAGYVPSGRTIHSLTARSINATIGVNGTYTIPSGYHDGTGKVKFSDTPGTATATATATTGSVTVNLGATGYYNKVTINQTATYNAGTTAGTNATRHIVCQGKGFSMNQSNYTTIATLNLTGYTNLAYQLKVTSNETHGYTCFQFFVNGTALTDRPRNMANDYNTPSDSSDVKGSIVTGFVNIPSSLRKANQPIQIKCMGASYGAYSFTADLDVYLIKI